MNIENQGTVQVFGIFLVTSLFSYCQDIDIFSTMIPCGEMDDIEDPLAESKPNIDQEIPIVEQSDAENENARRTTTEEDFDSNHDIPDAALKCKVVSM